MADKADFTVKLTDKVKRPARKAKGGIDDLRDSMRKAEKQTGRFRDAMGRLREANGRFVAGAGKGGFGSFGGAFDVFKGNLLTMAASKMAGLAAATAQAAGEFVTFGQNSRLAFQQLAKHGAEPEKLFEHSRALAKRFGLDLKDTTKQYQKFLALQFDPSQADKMIRMGADLRALGNSAEDIQGVFMALGQIKGKGRLQGEEMLQLAERGISTVLVQEEIGKLLGGKSNQEVQKLQQAGKVTAEVGLQAIENAIMRKLGESSLGEAGAKFADTTIDGMIGRFKAIGQDAGVTLVDRVTSPLTKLASKGLGAFERFVASPEGAATIDRLGVGLERMADMAMVISDAFGSGFGNTWETLVDSAKVFFGAFAGGDGATTTALLQTLGRSMGELAALAAGFTIALGATASALTVLGGGLWRLGVSIIDGLMEPLGTMVGNMLSWWDTVTALWRDESSSFISKVWNIGKEIMVGLRNGIIEFGMLPFKAIAGVGSSLADELSRVLGINSPSRVTMEMGMDLGRGLAIGTNRSASMVERAGSDMGQAHIGAMYEGPLVTSSGMASTAPDMPSGRGSAIHYAPTFHITADSADPDELGRVVARESRREIEAFFRDLAMEY